MSIVVVGTVAFDSIETPHGSAERVLGGSAAYFAMAARFFLRSNSWALSVKIFRRII